MKNSKVLIVVDESRATTKALRYVAQMAAGRPDFRACLVHTVPAPPSQLTEFRGAEKGRLRAYKSRWISAGEMTEQHALGRANAVLRRGGLARESIEAHCCYLVDGSRATEEILKLAQMRKCDTMVTVLRQPSTYIRTPFPNLRSVLSTRLPKFCSQMFPNFLIG
jgi:hypothetical protein